MKASLGKKCVLIGKDREGAIGERDRYRSLSKGEK